MMKLFSTGPISSFSSLKNTIIYILYNKVFAMDILANPLICSVADS